MATVENMQKEYWQSDKSKRRSPKHPVVVATFKPIVDIIKSYIPNCDDLSVLEVGCGNGYLQFQLEKCFNYVVGLDYSKEMLSINPCSNKLLGNVLDIDMFDNSYDVVISSHLLHHLYPHDRITALYEMKRVARKYIVIIEPNRNNPLVFMAGLVDKIERMSLFFTKNYIKSIMNKIGINNTNMEITGWIVPNKAPKQWIPIADIINSTFLRNYGFDICCVCKL